MVGLTWCCFKTLSRTISGQNCITGTFPLGMPPHSVAFGRCPSPIILLFDEALTGRSPHATCIFPWGGTHMNI